MKITLYEGPCDWCGLQAHCCSRKNYFSARTAACETANEKLQRGHIDKMEQKILNFRKYIFSLF